MNGDGATLLQGLLLALTAAGVAFHFLSLAAARRFFARERPEPGGWTPPVSILKPVRGADPEALANFLSFCRQDYPEYEVLFGVREADDPAIPLIEEARRACPERSIRLVVGGEPVGENRKVCNLHHLARHARHELLVVADSDVRAEPDLLRRLAAALAPRDGERAGLVSCPYRAVELRSLPAALEALSIATYFLPGVLLAERYREVDFALGATLALPREVLDEIGGFAALADYLADDFQLGRRVAALGYRVLLSPPVVECVAADAGLRPMLARLVRWSRTVRVCRPRGYRASLVTNSTLFALAFLAATGGTPFGWTVLAAQQGCRWYTAWQTAGSALGNRELARWFWLLPASDLLAAGLWLWGSFGKRVSWRGSRYRLLADGRIKEG